MEILRTVFLIIIAIVVSALFINFYIGGKR